MTRKHGQAVRDTTISSRQLPQVRREVTAPVDSELRDKGFTTLAVTSDACAAFRIASIAFRGQLDRCSEQPAQNAKQRLPQTMEQYDKLAKAIMSQLAKALSLSATAFEPLLESCNSQDQVRMKTASALEATRYGATDAHGNCTASSDTSANCEAHIDKGLLTLIYADTEQGLQIMEFNEWRELLIPAGHIAVLTGYTLERATCGLVKAAAHKVVLDNIAERNTLVYKLRALDSAVIDLYPTISSVNSSYIADRFKSSIGVHELMTFFARQHKSVNVLQDEDGNSKANATILRFGDHDVIIPWALSGFLILGNMVNICFVELTGARRSFLVSDAMPFCTLISAYATCRGMPVPMMKIYLDRIKQDKDSHESLKAMGVVDGSVLYVLLDLRGD